jgi:predicted Zn-ribbon and HTH transcriptional regulator
MPKRLSKEEVERRLSKKEILMLEPYKGSSFPIILTGPCGHTWKTKPLNALYSGSGCPECSYTNRNGRKFSQETVRSILYNVGSIMTGTYTNSRTPVNVKCSVCSYEWKVRIGNVVSHKSGCPRCAGYLSITQEEAINRFKQSGLFLTSSYKDSHSDVSAECMKCGHEWNGKPYHIFNGGGCPNCASYGFNPGKPAILYYIHVLGTIYYKIGITNRTLRQRFGRFFTIILEIRLTHFNIGSDAYEEEQSILYKYREDLYTGSPILGPMGKKEFFTRDVLNLHDRASGVQMVLF